MHRRSRATAFTGAALLAALAAVSPAVASSPDHAVTATHHRTDGSRSCGPQAYAVGYSDALDKLQVDGATVGGLSDIAWDAHAHAYASSVDNHGDDVSRIWFYSSTTHPRITRPPLVLEHADGTPYTGVTADNEGMAVLPNGEFVVSSELEPSIRIFGRDGVQRASLPVPARFRVAPSGEATDNATLEGLTVSRNGRQIVASMEGPLSGDTPSDGSPTSYRRFLVYAKHGHGWTLTKQVGYQVDPGNRIAEVQEYAPGKLLVLEAAWSADVGNTVQLYAVTGLSRATDVSDVADLGNDPHAVMRKTLIADVTACPSMGATAKETQINPLMGNFEGMTTRRLRGHAYRVALVSDDNFNQTQTTRFVNLVAFLP